MSTMTDIVRETNSVISDGPFRLKRSAIASPSLLRLNAYFQRFTDNDVWNEDTIIKRGKLLAELALKVWEYPETKKSDV